MSKPITALIQDFAQRMAVETGQCPSCVDLPDQLFDRLLVETGQSGGVCIVLHIQHVALAASSGTIDVYREGYYDER